MKTDSIGLYVHIPFCLRKCNYCDFCSFAGLDAARREDYISTLISEIYEYKREPKISLDTVFFGGGTPSLLSPDEFSKIHNAILDSFEILPDCEFTVEVNPKTANEKIFKEFISAGVNRISIGMQSIHENEMKILGRIHDFGDFVNTYNLARECGILNINVDVMYAIPEQTTESLKKTLAAVCELSPEHISAYGLIIEEGTPFYEMRDSLDFKDGDTEYEMYRTVTEILASYGYLHYEISNYAKPGFASRHNLKYWHNEQYIGVGISAYSYFEAKRYGNSAILEEYLSGKRKEYVSGEQINPDCVAYEYAMLGLRLSEGISLKKYERLSKRDLLSECKDKLSKYAELGYIKIVGDNLSLTESGFYVSNNILSELL